MYEAHSAAAGTTFSAREYTALTAGARNSYRDSLSCTGCGEAAYFIRAARNGRVACFGARPHGESCELASVGAEDSGRGNLPTDAPRVSKDDVFGLQPNRPRAIKHVKHAPGESPHNGRARRHVGAGPSGASETGIDLNRLLRRLVREPHFGQSKARIRVGSSTPARIASYCVPVTSVTEKHRNRLKVYWGTIRFVRTDADGVWLNVGRRGAPSIRMPLELVEELMVHKRIVETEDLQGAAFIFHGPMRMSPKGQMLIFPRDLEWFTVRLPHQDPDREL